MHKGDENPRGREGKEERRLGFRLRMAGFCMYHHRLYNLKSMIKLLLAKFSEAKRKVKRFSSLEARHKPRGISLLSFNFKFNKYLKLLNNYKKENNNNNAK